MKTNRARATFHDLAPEAESFRDCVLESLSRRAKSIPCRFLYDARGSALVFPPNGTCNCAPTNAPV